MTLLTLRDTINPVKDFYTDKSLAERWEFDADTIRRWRREGKLKWNKLGKGVRIPASEVKRLEAETLVSP